MFSLYISFSARVLLLSFICTLITNNSYPQDSISFASKKGGICFRIDDDQTISKYLQFAALFNKYNQHFCLAINLGSDAVTSEYILGLKQIQQSGHEIMDHTPTHTMNFFKTILDPDHYLNHSGVHNITSKQKIELEYAAVDLNCSKRKGDVNINKDTVSSTNGIFSNYSASDCYLYFPTLDKLVYINPNSGRINQNTVVVTDFWQDNIDLGKHQNIRFYNFDYNNIHLIIDALKVLIEETYRLSDYYGLERPKTWIQPGTVGPHIYCNEIKLAAGDLDYKSADIDDDRSLKVFNEYNPYNDKQFRLCWGDFDTDKWTLEKCKSTIADKIAKHQVLIGGGHFENLLDGWSGTLKRVEQLIAWCVENNIPIKTYSEWADILFNQAPDPNENIIPPLNTDLDENNVPDGYNKAIDGILKKTDGAPLAGNYCYSISKAGLICSITKLGGIEKGQNNFEIWTKGAPGNFIEVTFKIGSQNSVFKFPAENPQWTMFNLNGSINGNYTLNIPDDVSLMDIIVNCSQYHSGEVKISGMKMAKYTPLPVELSSFTASAAQNKITLKWRTISEIGNYGFEIQRKNGDESVTSDWQKIGFINGCGNSNSPKDYIFIDNNPVNCKYFIYRLKQIDNDGKYEYSKEVQVKFNIDNFAVYQNYPNPFNSSTEIGYNISSRNFVTMRIYNIAGEQVEEVSEGIREPGRYNVRWRPDDLPSGIYFGLLEAVSPDGLTHLRKSIKMVLMK